MTDPIRPDDLPWQEAWKQALNVYHSTWPDKGSQDRACIERFKTVLLRNKPPQPCCDAAKQLAEAVSIIRALYDRDFLNTCQHQDTHRGGTIWEICNECGFKWADDKGGKPEWVDPPEWTAAKEFLARIQPEPVRVDPVEAAVEQHYMRHMVELGDALTHRDQVMAVKDAIRTGIKIGLTITEGEAK